MKSPLKGFADWACDPKRTVEERFGAEVLIESTLGLWLNKHSIHREVNYSAEQLRKKDRLLNPAYEPCFTAEDADRVETVLPELQELNIGYFEDRPLRDLSFLRFCPPLNTVRIHKAEITDWSPMEYHTSLTKLDVWDSVARDLRVISQLTKLQSLHLWLGAPWPNLGSMAKLSELREIVFYGNILIWQAVPELPQLRDAKIQHSAGYNLPLRSMADLPAMPELRRLYLINTADLAGVERFTQLLNLEIYGYFTDLDPLTPLKNLTHLTLSGGSYSDLAPLAKLPQLRRLLLRNEDPPDFTPLADAPRLSEIALEEANIVPAELASLNAMLYPWSEDFAAPVPRPLAPLRLVAEEKWDLPDRDGAGEPRPFGEDADMQESEGRWFYREVDRRLTKLLGRQWGPTRHYLSGRAIQHLTISRPEDIDRLPAIVQTLRETIAAARYNWTFFFIVDSLAEYERDIEQIYADDGEEFNADRERQEWEYRKQREREHKAFLERKYRHRLQQELGTPINPADFAPPPPPKPDEEDDAVPAGNFVPEPAPEFDLETRLHCGVQLTEKAIYVTARDRKLAEMLFELKSEG